MYVYEPGGLSQRDASEDLYMEIIQRLQGKHMKCINTLFRDSRPTLKRYVII